MYGEDFVILESDGLVITEMTEGAAREIASWKYGPPYEMYDFDGDEAEVEQVLNGYHFPVYEGKNFDPEEKEILEKPIGFVAVGPAARLENVFSRRFYRRSGATDIAVGLRPELCGQKKKLGVRLTGAAENFALQEFPDDGVRLAVDRKNARALITYLQVDFRVVGRFPAVVKVHGKKKLAGFYLMEMGK